jgi:hypothetical protein
VSNLSDKFVRFTKYKTPFLNDLTKKHHALRNMQHKIMKKNIEIAKQNYATKDYMHRSRFEKGMMVFKNSVKKLNKLEAPNCNDDFSDSRLAGKH